MRISFSFGGGGPRRGRETRSGRNYYKHIRPRVSVSVPLGATGSAIVFLIFFIIGTFVALTNFWNFISLAIGIVFALVGIFGFLGSLKKAKSSRNHDDSDE